MTIEKIMVKMGYDLRKDENIIPKDDSTLFICSGMQQFRDKFKSQTHEKIATLQSCIRTNDLTEVGDGTHLTYFEMLGNFSFGNDDYEQSVELWDWIIRDLGLRRSITSVHYHPSRHDHRLLWTKRGYLTVPDESCIWSDGEINGFCTELYVGHLEIGNLVNTLDHSVDVGFGYERLVQVVCGEPRVDSTPLFDQTLDPICRDHVRTLTVLHKHGIEPNGKGRGFITKRLLRRVLDTLPERDWPFKDWLDNERYLRDRTIKHVRRVKEKFSDRDEKFWWVTFGILPEELKLL